MTNVQYIGGAPEPDSLQAQQSLPDNFNADAAQAFADGLQDGVTANPCDWTFTQTTAGSFATHCGALAQNMDISDIKENDRRTLSFWETVNAATTDIDVSSTLTLTFADNITAIPQELALGFISLAASVSDDKAAEPGQIYLTSFIGKTLENPVDKGDGTYDDTIRGGLSGETLTNRMLEVEFKGVNLDTDILRLAPEPNTIDVAVKISLWELRAFNEPANFHASDVTDIDFDVQLADQLLLSTRE